jgi:pSer/pThr/pTyr-binding forkhead associated (FHA) protein
MASLILITEEYPRQVFLLGRANLMIGRDDVSEIRIADNSVSRNHASIVLEGDEYVVRDNGSLNGTYVNGDRVSRRVLRHHDVLRFGSCLFLVDMAEAKSARKIEVPPNEISKTGNIIDLSPKSLTPGYPSEPLKLVLSVGSPRKKAK